MLVKRPAIVLETASIPLRTTLVPLVVPTQLFRVTSVFVTLTHIKRITFLGLLPASPAQLDLFQTITPRPAIVLGTSSIPLRTTLVPLVVPTQLFRVTSVFVTLTPTKRTTFLDLLPASPVQLDLILTITPRPAIVLETSSTPLRTTLVQLVEPTQLFRVTSVFVTLTLTKRITFLGLLPASPVQLDLILTITPRPAIVLGTASIPLRTTPVPLVVPTQLFRVTSVFVTLTHIKRTTFLGLLPASPVQLDLILTITPRPAIVLETASIPLRTTPVPLVVPTQLFRVTSVFVTLTLTKRITFLGLLPASPVQLDLILTITPRLAIVLGTASIPLRTTLVPLVVPTQLFRVTSVFVTLTLTKRITFLGLLPASPVQLDLILTITPRPAIVLETASTNPRTIRALHAQRVPWQLRTFAFVTPTSSTSRLRILARPVLSTTFTSQAAIRVLLAQPTSSTTFPATDAQLAWPTLP
ncbi:Hypothetical_protein [Hexamita inflata]|uniref:Hypothetical_protein n=1 Tax=Hexamita inflata TaxID=28002 RepID=A0AA86TQM7_9EUKA|nr:Hypothetical protein HINF_LOCUS10757 [Hexamita inflata]